MSQLSRFLNRPRVVDTEIVAVDEAICFDLLDLDGNFVYDGCGRRCGIVVLPEDRPSVEPMEIPLGRAPVQDDDGWSLDGPTGWNGLIDGKPSQGFAAARIETCFRECDVYSDGSRGPVGDWKLGPVEEAEINATDYSELTK